MISRLTVRVPLVIVALAAAVLASIGLPGMAAASSNTWSADVYSGSGVRWQDPDYHACAATSTLMMLNFVNASDTVTGRDGLGAQAHRDLVWHPTTSYDVQERILAYSRAHMTMVLQGTGGTDPVGWRNALNYYGWGSVDAGVYTIETTGTFLNAAKASVEALARTGKPVAIAGWAGSHAQIMNGYRVTGGDPKSTTNFTIQGVYITDPLRSDGYRDTYISLSTWQSGDPHVRFQQYWQTDSPYRDPITGTIGKIVWYGRWLIIAPVR
jgi:hypothetical protein